MLFEPGAEHLNSGRFISMGAGGEQHAAGSTMAEYNRGKAATWLMGRCLFKKERRIRYRGEHLGQTFKDMGVVSRFL